MGLTCSQSAARTKPHLLFGETRPSSIPSRPPPALLQSPFFQLLSSTCKPKHSNHHHITAVGNQYPGAILLHHAPGYTSLPYQPAPTKPLAAGHLLPSSPLICRGAAGEPHGSRLVLPSLTGLPVTQSAYSMLALPSEDLCSFRDLQCCTWAAGWSALPCALCLYLTA